MPIYMKVDGVDGSVTAAGHEKWIELDSAQMGVNRHVTEATGRGTNREASAPSVSEIVITKPLDCASTGLFRLSLWGEGKKVKIDFCVADPGVAATVSTAPPAVDLVPDLTGKATPILFGGGGASGSYTALITRSSGEEIPQ